MIMKKKKKDIVSKVSERFQMSNEKSYFEGWFDKVALQSSAREEGDKKNPVYFPFSVLRAGFN